MARAVGKMIGDEKLRTKLAARGLETCTGFTWENIANRFEAALEDLLEKCK